MHKLTPIPNLLEDKEDKTLFIVGGGPSLTNFDWSLLEGKNVLVLNRGVEKVPNALALLWNDVKFHKDNEENIKNFQGIKITTTRYMPPGSSHPCECDIIWVKGKNYLGDFGGPMEESPYVINQGSNTGYSALNVAYHLGAKTIYLLGYDMKLDKDKTNWHNGYPNQNPLSTKMIETFSMVFWGSEKLYKEKDIKIYNVNNDSELTEFEIKTLEEIFA